MVEEIKTSMFLIYGHKQQGLFNPMKEPAICHKNPYWLDGSIHHCTDCCPLFQITTFDQEEESAEVTLYCATPDPLIIICQIEPNDDMGSGETPNLSV